MQARAKAAAAAACRGYVGPPGNRIRPHGVGGRTPIGDTRPDVDLDRRGRGGGRRRRARRRARAPRAPDDRPRRPPRGRARAIGRGRRRPSPATWPRLAPSRGSCAAGRAPERRSRPTRSTGCARRCAPTPRPPPAPALERRERARAEPAGDLGGGAGRDPRRLVRRRAERRALTIERTSSTWRRSRRPAGAARPRSAAAGVASTRTPGRSRGQEPWKLTTPSRSRSTIAPSAQQQVDVPEHLRQRQVGLRDGDVSPQLLGDLVGGARLRGDQAADLLGAARVQAEALVDQRDVVGDRLAVAGQHQRRGPSRASCAARPCR